MYMEEPISKLGQSQIHDVSTISLTDPAANRRQRFLEQQKMLDRE